MLCFSRAMARLSRKVCIGVLAPHQRPWWVRTSFYAAIQASRSACSASMLS